MKPSGWFMDNKDMVRKMLVDSVIEIDRCARTVTVTYRLRTRPTRQRDETVRRSWCGVGVGRPAKSLRAAAAGTGLAEAGAVTVMVRIAGAPLVPPLRNRRRPVRRRMQHPARNLVAII